MKDNIDTTLDEALAQTFPASDPFYITPGTDRIRALSVDRNAQTAHATKTLEPRARVAAMED